MITKTSKAQRVGRLIGLAYRKVADLESRCFRTLPRLLSVVIKVTTRAALIGVLAFIAWIPFLVLASLAVAGFVLTRLGDFEIDASTVGSEEAEVGVQGFGIYRDGVRVG